MLTKIHYSVHVQLYTACACLHVYCYDMDYKGVVRCTCTGVVMKWAWQTLKRHKVATTVHLYMYCTCTGCTVYSVYLFSVLHTAQCAPAQGCAPVQCTAVQYRKWYRGGSRMIPKTLRLYLESSFDLSGVSFRKHRTQRWFRSTYENSEGEKSTSKYDKKVPGAMLNFYATRPKTPGA